MPTLQIRDLDEAVYRRLVEAAHKNHRSLARQAAAVLGESTDADTLKKEARQDLLLRIQSSEDVWPETLPSPESLLAEDRNR